MKLAEESIELFKGSTRIAKVFYTPFHIDAEYNDYGGRCRSLDNFVPFGRSWTLKEINDQDPECENCQEKENPLWTMEDGKRFCRKCANSVCENCQKIESPLWIMEDGKLVCGECSNSVCDNCQEKTNPLWTMKDGKKFCKKCANSVGVRVGFTFLNE